jgi:hypothetical protein
MQMALLQVHVREAGELALDVVFFKKVRLICNVLLYCTTQCCSCDMRRPVIGGQSKKVC